MSSGNGPWPLTGLRVLVTRSSDRSSTLVEALRAEHAVPLALPVISIHAASTHELDAALEAISDATWVAFTSAAGVQIVVAHASRRGRTQVLSASRFAAVGPATAAALRQSGYPAAFVPASASGKSLGRQLPDVEGRKVVLPQAATAQDDLKSELQARGALVYPFAVYSTERGAVQPEAWKNLVEGGIDCVTFTSGSTVDHLLGSLEDANLGHGAMMLSRAVIACIGPTTAERARHHGLHPDVIANEHNVDGLVTALRHFFRDKETTP